jgi:hypothetical protein
MTNTLPLAGIKVIDFTGVQAGPACTQLLAWFGAEVLKVERTSGGDVTRNQLRDIPELDALYFTMLNSNKRSLAIDTKTPEGLEVMEDLIQRSDVLVENFAPGAMDRMGLSWERIQELNPRLVYGSVKGSPISRCTRTLRRQPAEPRRRPDSGMGPRPSAARRSETRTPECISRSASSLPCSAARRQAGARRYRCRCRTPASTCAG